MLYASQLSGRVQNETGGVGAGHKLITAFDKRESPRPGKPCTRLATLLVVPPGCARCSKVATAWDVRRYWLISKALTTGARLQMVVLLHWQPFFPSREHLGCRGHLSQIFLQPPYRLCSGIFGSRSLNLITRLCSDNEAMCNPRRSLSHSCNHPHRHLSPPFVSTPPQSA